MLVMYRQAIAAASLEEIRTDAPLREFALAGSGRAGQQDRGRRSNGDFFDPLDHLARGFATLALGYARLIILSRSLSAVFVIAMVATTASAMPARINTIVPAPLSSKLSRPCAES